VRFRVWRSAEAPSDAAENNGNMDAQLQSVTCTTENFLYDLLHTNLFVPSHFWTTCTKFDNCCQHYIVTCRKKLYGFACVIYVLGSRLLLWNILQISQLSVRSAVHKLFRQFLDFSQVLTTISRKLWCHLATR